MGSSRTRARTRVPWIGRQILNHCATRESQPWRTLKNWFGWWILRWVYWSHIVALTQSPPSAQARTRHRNVSSVAPKWTFSGNLGWEKIAPLRPHFRIPPAFQSRRPHLPHTWDISYHTVRSRRKILSVHKSAWSRGARTLSVLFDTIFPGLQQCLAHSEHSNYTCWMNEWMGKREKSMISASNLQMFVFRTSIISLWAHGSCDFIQP